MKILQGRNGRHGSKTYHDLAMYEKTDFPFSYVHRNDVRNVFVLFHVVLHVHESIQRMAENRN